MAYSIDILLLHANSSCFLQAAIISTDTDPHALLHTADNLEEVTLNFNLAGHGLLIFMNSQPDGC